VCPKKAAKKKKTKKKSSKKKGEELEKAERSRDIRDILKRLGEKVPEEPESKQTYGDEDYYFGDEDYSGSGE